MFCTCLPRREDLSALRSHFNTTSRKVQSNSHIIGAGSSPGFGAKAKALMKKGAGRPSRDAEQETSRSGFAAGRVESAWVSKGREVPKILF